jgi:hypothetical protein
MTENEMELIEIIREHQHPEIALITAIETTILYLKQLESSLRPIVVGFREHT